MSHQEFGVVQLIDADGQARVARFASKATWVDKADDLVRELPVATYTATFTPNNGPQQVERTTVQHPLHGVLLD